VRIGRLGLVQDEICGTFGHALVQVLADRQPGFQLGGVNAGGLVGQGAAFVAQRQGRSLRLFETAIVKKRPGFQQVAVVGLRFAIPGVQTVPCPFYRLAVKAK